MYMVLISLLIVAGSWAAWRRNPLYSTRTTLSKGAIILAMIGALVLCIIGVVHIAMKQSQTVAMIIVFGAVIVLTIAMILGIMRLTTPRVAAIPSTVSLLHYHRAKLRPWLHRWLWSMFGVALLALVLPGATKGIAYALGSILGLLGIVMLAAGYYAARIQDRALTALQFKPWVHWQYNPTEWDTWVAAQVARTQAVPPTFIFRRDWKKLILPVALIAGGVFIFGPGGWVWKAGYVAFIGLLLLGLALLGGKSDHAAPDRIRKSMQHATPEAFLGDEGVFCDGTLTPWLSTDDWLTSATIDPGQSASPAVPSLVLQFEKVQPAGAGGVSITPMVKRILLPTPAPDLTHLQQALTAKCPKATVRLC